MLPSYCICLQSVFVIAECTRISFLIYCKLLSWCLQSAETKSTAEATKLRNDLKTLREKHQKLREFHSKNIEIAKGIQAKNKELDSSYKELESSKKELEARVKELEQELEQAQKQQSTAAAAGTQQEQYRKMAHDFKQHAEKASQVSSFGCRSSA